LSVRRGRRLPLEELQPYLFALPEPGRLIDLAQTFGNRNPVELEVGFGKGAFLVETAPLHPERNYLGIEIDRGLQLYAANRIAKRNLANVRLGCGDAGRLLAEHLPAGSLAAIHVYFPDPWWKKRHRKRRVFTEVFARSCAKVLEPGGRLLTATDVAEYFQAMMGLLGQLPEFAAHDVSRIEPAGDAGSLTNFEKKAFRVGRPVWRAEFRLGVRARG
jgi:tRNA (guanine-N7-)-methyltransferase